MPDPDPTEPVLLSCQEITERISKTRGCCNFASVWRAITRLKLTPAKLVQVGAVKTRPYFTEGQADQIAASLRPANGKTVDRMEIENQIGKLVAIPIKDRTKANLARIRTLLERSERLRIPPKVNEERERLCREHDALCSEEFTCQRILDEPTVIQQFGVKGVECLRGDLAIIREKQHALMTAISAQDDATADENTSK